MKKLSYGLSLLEVLCSLVIMAVIFSLVVTYFFNNQQNVQTSKVATQIQQLASVSYEWQSAQAQGDFSGLSLETLQNAGLFTKGNDYTELNPWGGAYSLSADTDNPHYLRITIPTVPEAACNNLREKMKNLAHAQASEGDCSKNNYFVTL